MREIYADNAATTAVSPHVLEAMTPYFGEFFGNPSSLHSFGRKAAAAMDDARKTIASYLGCDPRELYFTSSGTEADNWAVVNAVRLGAKKGKKHLITTAFEHHALLHTMEQMEKQGCEVTWLDVHEDGVIRMDELEQAIRPDTALVSIMYANNEIGTIQPIPEIGKLCREKGVLFHTDAVQAAGHLPIDVEKLCIDMLSISAHKFHGPKGIGMLYCRRTVALSNLLYGGGQERGKRPGTESPAMVVGMATAFKDACDAMEADMPKVAVLRDKLIAGLSVIPRSRLNGHPTKRLPGNVNFAFEGIEGESLLLNLDMKGIAASSGSACTSGSLDPSHVLLSIGLPHEVAHGSLRLSLSHYTTEEDVDYIIQEVPPIVAYLREISPVWERIMKEEQVPV
ncbi:MAG: cysteine desulfurase NifS [Peptococcaceae bacterium]|jgi:cysteine desulfurase|nr:cysteine desulfurase NifS [Peptococcaceae bacterium]